MEILVRNGANINEKDVKNISVGETDDFERDQIERAECIFLRTTHSFLFFISFVNQSPLFIGKCLRFRLSLSLFSSLFSFSLFLFSSYFHFFSHFCKEIFADILSSGCLMSLWEELWAGMTLREWA